MDATNRNRNRTLRVGIMGGTFDPIHNGHLFIAEESHARFALDCVVFIPNAQPPHKADAHVTSARHRYAMTEIATQNNAHFVCSPMELNRSGPSYTADTLRELRQQQPDAELFYITGVDAVAEIMTWHQPEEVIRLATFIAASRPGFDPQTLEARLPSNYLARILMLTTTALDISSTDIRKRIRTGKPARYLMPDAVLDYIAQEQLYREGAPEGATPAAKIAPFADKQETTV